MVWSDHPAAEYGADLACLLDRGQPWLAMRICSEGQKQAVHLRRPKTKERRKKRRRRRMLTVHAVDVARHARSRLLGRWGG